MSPYASTAQLPESVRKAYSARCQGVFMRAFNEHDGDESSRFAVAHTAAKNCASSGKADGAPEETSMTGKASTNDTRQALEEALRAGFGSSCYVQDFDPDEGWVIYQRHGDNLPATATGYFRLGFEVGEGGAVTLGDDPMPVEQRTSFVPKRAPGASVPTPMKAAELDDEELGAWFAGKHPRRLLAIPFHGPLKARDGKTRDLDFEFFDARTDIKPDWFEARPVDWHHSKDPSGKMNGVTLGKADRLGTLDGQLGEPDDDGWWVDLWFKAGEARLALIERLVRRGAELFGSTYAYPNMIRRGKAGHIDVWPYMVQTLSTSPQNTHSVLRSAKAVLGAFDEAEIPVGDRALRGMLAALEDLRDLPATAATGRLSPAPDLPWSPAAKAGRELSGANEAEIAAWWEALDGLAQRVSRFRSEYRSRRDPITNPDTKETTTDAT